MSAVEAQLREELDEAREEIRQLRDLIAPEIWMPFEWNLSWRQATFFRALLVRQVVSTAILQAALREPGKDVTPDGLVKVIASQLRRKTRSFGVEIRTFSKQGYALERRLDWQEALRAGACRLHAPAWDIPLGIHQHPTKDRPGGDFGRSHV